MTKEDSEDIIITLIIVIGLISMMILYYKCRNVV